MKSKLLFPNRFKIIGWILFVPSAIVGILFLVAQFQITFLDVNVFAIYSDMIFGKRIIFGIDQTNIADEVLGILLITGGILIAFSKEKLEDEFIAKTRLESLVWATYINYAVLLFCIIFFYGFGFMYVMIFNMFTIIIFFICRFYFILYKTKKSLSNEK